MSPLIIAVLIALAVFGSVYMLKPSPRQRRLATLRLEAIKLGIQIKLETFKADSKKMGVRDDIVAARYECVDLEAKSQAIRWCVVRQSGWEQEGLVEGWSWHNIERKPELAALNALLNDLSEDVKVIEVYDNRACIWTMEGKEAQAELIKLWIDQAQQL
jgi:hypothetical protein